MPVPQKTIQRSRDSMQIWDFMFNGSPNIRVAIFWMLFGAAIFIATNAIGWISSSESFWGKAGILAQLEAIIIAMYAMLYVREQVEVTRRFERLKFTRELWSDPLIVKASEWLLEQLKKTNQDTVGSASLVQTALNLGNLEMQEKANIAFSAFMTCSLFYKSGALAEDVFFSNSAFYIVVGVFLLRPYFLNILYYTPGYADAIKLHEDAIAYVRESQPYLEKVYSHPQMLEPLTIRDHQG